MPHICISQHDITKSNVILILVPILVLKILYSMQNFSQSHKLHASHLHFPI